MIPQWRTFRTACEKRNLNKVHAMIDNNFPAYLYIKQIFNIIFEND